MFKDVLRQLRNQQGLTQEELATKLGVTAGTIGNYEQGQRLPKNDETWIKIANYFGVSVDYLMGVEIAPSTSPQIIAAYGGLKNPHKEKLIRLIQDTDIPDNQINLLINMIESWK